MIDIIQSRGALIFFRKISKERDGSQRRKENRAVTVFQLGWLEVLLSSFENLRESLIPWISRIITGALLKFYQAISDLCMTDKIIGLWWSSHPQPVGLFILHVEHGGGAAESSNSLSTCLVLWQPVPSLQEPPH